jgi:hypothetical protein
LTLRSSFKTIFLSLWDEEQGRLVSFRQEKLMSPARPIVSRPPKPDFHPGSTDVAILRRLSNQPETSEDDGRF